MEQITEFINKIDNEDQITPSTRRAYSSDLLKFNKFLLNNQKARETTQQITVKNFFRFLEHEKKLGLKPSTLHRRRVSLKKFAEFLTGRGELEKGSVQEVAGWQENLWEEIANRESVCLTKDEVALIFKVMDSEDKPRNLRDKAIISLILGTGISIGTLVDLNLSDINLEKHQFRVDMETNQWSGITDSVEYFEKYLTISRPELTQTASEKALFVSQMGGRITRQGAWQVIKAWGIAAGLQVPLSPRVLRHTAVRRMIEQDKPQKEIQQMLGHNNVHSTQALIRKIIKSIDRGGLNGHERIYHD